MVRVLAGPMGLGGSGIERSGGGSTAVADVIVALGILREVRLSQDCCAAAGAGTNTTRQTTNKIGMNRSLMRVPPKSSKSTMVTDVYTALAVARKSLISGDEV
jgi:hypothetical protein